MRAFPLGSLLILTLALILSSSRAPADAADFDPIVTQSMALSAANPDATLAATAANLKAVFQNFQPVLDSGSRVVSPSVVTGSATNPHLELSIEKCVLFICKAVALKSDISIRQVTGTCSRNLLLTADLTKSGELLSDVYQALHVSICMNHTSATSAHLNFSVLAEHATQYSSGIVQNIDLEFLKLQTPAMLDSIKRSLTANGASLREGDVNF